MQRDIAQGVLLRRGGAIEIVVTAFLVALSVLIPLVGTSMGLRVEFGMFSATLLSHLPLIVAIFISPRVSLCTSVGGVLGFALCGAQPGIIARAASHVIFAVVGACIKKYCNIVVIWIVTAALHSICESLIVVMFAVYFFKIDRFDIMFFSTMFFTLLHYTVDFVITFVFLRSVRRFRIFPVLPPVLIKKD